jgi:hypothetical protein
VPGNRLQERDNMLPGVSYDALLKVISEVVKRRTDLFQVGANSLYIDIERVAREVVSQVQSSARDITTFGYVKGTTYSTANFPDNEAFDAFRLLIERIQDQLVNHFRTALAPSGRSLEEYARGLAASPNKYTSDSQGRPFFKLSYPFSKSGEVKRRRLHLQARTKPGKSDMRLLGHKLTISVQEILTFEQRLVEALCNQLDLYEVPEREIERTRTILEQRLQDESSELGVLTRILKRESSGRLQREARIGYLSYLAAALRKKKQQDDRHKKGLALLETMVERLRKLEVFLRQERSDDFFQVNYCGIGANYCNLFSRAEVFDLLPIFGDIEGMLGETYDPAKGEQVFRLGMKMKLNGHVQTYPSVFDYYLTLLDPGSQEHQERASGKNVHQRAFIEKVLKLALLYYFIFKKMDDPAYNPAQDVEQELLVTFRLPEAQMEGKKQERLRWLKDGLRRPEFAENLRLLRDVIAQCLKSPGSDFDSWSTTCYLSVSADILELDEDRMRNEKKFFRADALSEKGMGMLKYVTIEEASAAGNTLCSLPVTLHFEPVYYYSIDRVEEEFKLTYYLGSLHFLPVIYMPVAERSLCQTYYKEYSRVDIPYAPSLPFADQPNLLFIYHFTYLLLNYLCLKLLSGLIQPKLPQGQRLFLPLLRIHQKKKVPEKEEQSGEEAFLRALSKTLSHVLREQGVIANAQGLHIAALKQQGSGAGQYKLANALSSLYGVLPKRFALPAPPQLENLAVIVVSSRKCDTHRDASFSLSTIYGEVIGIRKTRGDPSKVFVLPLDTFSANEASDNMYRAPTVLQDQARKCYERGYRHILYVAQAPYSSALHLTSAEKTEEQFFMSGSIIESLKGGRHDLHIYPVYCDRFYVVKTDGTITESLYVDDTSELRTLLNDPARSAVVFFNLLNGLVVGQDRLYNGVVSYATLINVYDDPIYDQDIRNHLLDGSQPGSLKKDLLDFLTLLHFARYERNAKSISMKLDPYDGIIGSDSVGTLSLLEHMYPGTSFNMLAFLTEVRSVLNRQFSGYTNMLLEEEKPGEGEDAAGTNGAGDDDKQV